jgi:hypothetical protein
MITASFKTATSKLAKHVLLHFTSSQTTPLQQILQPIWRAAPNIDISLPPLNTHTDGYFPDLLSNGQIRFATAGKGQGVRGEEGDSRHGFNTRFPAGETTCHSHTRIDDTTVGSGSISL